MSGDFAEGVEGRQRHVVLVGMMGSGKTTTARAIADRLAWPMSDCDADLEAREAITGAQFAARHGVDALHELEEEVLLRALGRRQPSVIAAAGWVVEADRCRQALADHATVVWLDVPLDDLMVRMSSSDHRRRLERRSVAALLSRRRTWFQELAALHLDALQPVDVLARQVVAALPDLLE